mmetsp:Transcript_10968/g.34858  ORF Transcript_10968/g.34858 Transcript_10968/m.34858 type:complete len:251 (+) Transcript_10968:193-945(+)|eukprot:CAMPEP_0182860762 /NCGR_PEP_ID=MMETSP0034_2-20130328/5114_1 /TAXON_ID=156128 /ORGANISM="Nephroselmis pyriformis, Strain CCMP717" /LENGTH=250 /DNA_ID=CAMNT_0024992611 /DNA_START=74 /DNA_END=826 /DNA_ORIENTATION=-
MASITGSAVMSSSLTAKAHTASRNSIPSFNGMRAASISHASASVKLAAPRMAKGIFASAALPEKFTSVTPSGDRVVGKLGKKQTATAGGILLPSASQGSKNQATIVSTGKDTAVKTGDVVLYSQYAGTPISTKADGDMIILKVEDCIGVMGGDGFNSMKPLGDRILIKVDESEEATAGGVLLVESAKEKPLTGEVVAVGEGSKGPDGTMTPLSIPAGATVLYQKFSGAEFSDGSGDYIVVREGDIMAVLA